MAESKKAPNQQLTVDQLNTFLEALQANTAASKLSKQAQDDLLKSLPVEFLPIAITDGNNGGMMLEGRLPSTLGELTEMARHSKQVIRDGHNSGGLSEHAEQLEYNRILDGALAAVEKTMGPGR